MNENTKSEQPEWAKTLEKEAASTVFQLVSEWLGKGGAWLIDNIAWEKASVRYVERWIDRWGKIKPLGADRPIPLHQLFVQVCAAPRSVIEQFSSVEAMEKMARANPRQGFSPATENATTETKPESALKIANEYPRLNILGAPGAGKSTLLRRLGLEALLPRRDNIDRKWRYRGVFEHPAIPILIELRSLRNARCQSYRDLVQLLANELETSEFPGSLKLLLGALKRGALLILLDGVDEIPTENLELAVDAIRNFVNKYPDCRYVLSCRTAFYRDWFSGFHDFVLVDFDDEQIAHFANNWFNRPEEFERSIASLFLNAINTEDHRATRELAGSPLLLTFLCLVFRKTQQFPKNRAQLYQKALRIYLEEWNASKFVHNEPIYTDLSPEMEVELLKDIAGPAFLDGQYFFVKNELAKAIKAFLEKELNAPKSLSPGKILHAIAVQQGLFVERAEGFWTFSHLTIQEYLAAAWILEEGHTDRVIRTRFGDDRLRELFLLMAGLTRSDGLLHLMMDVADNLIIDFEPILKLFTQLEAASKNRWLFVKERAVEAAALNDATGRALVRLLALAHALSRSVDSGFALSIASKMVPVHVCTSIQRCVAHIPFHATDAIEVVKDRSMLGALVRYFNIFMQICDCREAALRVTEKGWEDLCTRFLICPIANE